MPDTFTLEREPSQQRVLTWRGPLDGLRPIAVPGRLVVAPAAELARLSLRGNATALGAAFGLALSVEPCRAASAGERTALWLGPDEWLLLAPPGTLDPAIAVQGAAVVDIGHRQIGLTLDGPGASDALAAGCPLDLHISAFPSGMCTRTVFGKAEIVLWRQSEMHFHMEVWRSFAGYVHGLLAVASRDGG
jgi:sarcosine oxidase subunit gamma